MVRILSATDENSRIQMRIRKSWVRIRGSGSVSKVKYITLIQRPCLTASNIPVSIDANQPTRQKRLTFILKM
jgi:hypothetical protein